jgi:hypothetical protein
MLITNPQEGTSEFRKRVIDSTENLSKENKEIKLSVDTVVKMMKTDKKEEIPQARGGSQALETKTPFSNLPNQNRHFISREEYLKEIYAWMKTETKVFALCGLGGVGKTSIALKAAWKLKEEDPAPSIFWLTSDEYNEGENSHKLDKSIKNLADELELTNKNIDNVLLFFKNLNDKFLVVIDNLDQENFSPRAIKILKGNWLQNKNAKLLITTRLNSRVIESFYKDTFKISALKVDCLSNEEGGKMIEDLVGVKSPNGEANMISNMLGGLCLPLKHASVTINLNFNKDFKGYAKELQKNRLKMLDEEPGLEKSNVVRHLSAPIRLLEARYPQAVYVLQILAFHSNIFFQNDIEDFFGDPGVQIILRPKKMSQLQIKRAFCQLKKFHLIDEFREGYCDIHCLISEIVMKGTPASEQSRIVFLGNLIKPFLDVRKHFHSARQQLVHVEFHPWFIRCFVNSILRFLKKDITEEKLFEMFINTLQDWILNQMENIFSRIIYLYVMFLWGEILQNSMFHSQRIAFYISAFFMLSVAYKCFMLSVMTPSMNDFIISEKSDINPS